MLSRSSHRKRTRSKHSSHSLYNAEGSLYNAKSSSTNLTKHAFFNKRQNKRAYGRKKTSRVEISNVGTSSTSSESVHDFTKRAAKLSFAQESQRSSKLCRIAVIVGLVLLVAIVGVIVGIVVFFHHIGSQYALTSEETPTNLVAQSNNQPYYFVVSADLYDSDGTDTIDALQLVRVDEEKKQVCIVSIPPNLQVTLSDRKTHPISESIQVGGNTELISAVSNFAGVSVSHFVKTDESGIRKIVRCMGGFHVNVSEEIDDPDAGTIYIPAGEQILDENATMVFLRANNFKNAISTKQDNQALMLSSAIIYLTGNNGSIHNCLDAAAGSFATDWSGDGLFGALCALSGVEASQIYRVSVPGYISFSNGSSCFVSSTTSWLSVMQKVKDGADPSYEKKSTINDIVPSNYTLTVRNGSGLDGGAANLAKILESLGFQIKEVGNTDSKVYDDTLVVYSGEDKKQVADAIVDALKFGRSVDSGMYYNYDSDILVVLGSDWKP